MKKSVILLILLVLVLFTAGCDEKTPENSTSSEANMEKSVVAITQLEQVNTSLQKNPVFVKVGSRWCPECRSLKPVLDKLAVEYQGKATIASIDADKNLELAEYFEVEFIPDSFVIVGIENGTYVYMQENGNVSTDRSKARFVGRNDTDEEMFKNVLNLALIQKEKADANETKR
ncbi:Thioredoxin [Methanosarcina barkeri str. Wiesmoor]|uniref:Thioredoxin n=2 Tax=Methanosarcina barkeri TaxID=2208 RepID=A0A0E3QKJ7_METBA|nr:thioredoxin family protein [Methanosarcina barkeri]AKB50368.1 Thioredoxin [Methanosarcina barkeri str. Wiesmoor]